MATADLFTPTDAPKPEKATPTGLLVTNHLNLMYMLAAGLVMPPAGFGDKYYQDPLECFPGWIPLFTGRPPKGAIESSIREARHLRPCIVEIDLSRLSGQVMAFGEAARRALHFPDQLDGTERAILVPAPLPTSWITAIHFRSVGDLRGCEADAKDFGNVPLEDFKRETRRKTLFTKTTDTPWPPSDGPSERIVPLQAPLAAGGVMAMLLRFGNLGAQAVRTCRLAFDPDDDTTSSADEHPILAGLRTWMQEGTATVSAPGDTETDRTRLRNTSQAMLFWQAVERLVAWRDGGRTASAEDTLIGSLDPASAKLDPRLRLGMEKLHDTLVSLTEFPDATASELFERHGTPLARAMTLFLLRQDCTDLLDFHDERLAEPDWLAAAILFGVRDGWLNLPVQLRAPRTLAGAISHRMARLAHRISGTGIVLGEPPGRVRPLRELFGDGSAWRSNERSAAFELARTQKWDCVHTRIRLRPGEYTLTVAGGSTCIDLPGEPDVSPQIDTKRFLDSLARARLNPKTEAKIREMLPA